MLTAPQFILGCTLIDEDLSAGVLARLELDYDEVYQVALDLSKSFGQTIPIKTADLLHIAVMEFGFDEFVTADKQQQEFAIRVGYRAILLPS